MKARLLFVALLSVFVIPYVSAQINVPNGFEAAALNQDFGGGFDYLPNGDIIGMYADLNMIKNSYIGIIDANGDGVPASVQKVYDFGSAVFGGFCNVSPDGSFAIFVDSLNYKVYSISLPDYNVSEIVPTSGSFDGAFDLAFIDDGACYISANPAWGTTNKILHLNLNTNALVEIVSVDNTFSGGIDVDSGGNLYYVKSKANFPPQAGDYSVHSFQASELGTTLGGGGVLGIDDAQELASGLNGGYDVAWHASGDLYVSDPNDGKIYKIASVSDFATLDTGIGGGFTHLAFYKREQVFGTDALTQAKLAVGYLDDLGGPTPANIYQINPVAPPLGVAANGTTFSPGDQLVVSIAVQQQVSVPFDGYVVFVGPAGITYSSTPRGFEKGIKAYISDVPGLQQDFERDVVDLAIPQTAPVGSWTVYTGIVSAGATATPANALAIDSIEITVE